MLGGIHVCNQGHRFLEIVLEARIERERPYTCLRMLWVDLLIRYLQLLKLNHVCYVPAGSSSQSDQDFCQWLGAASGQKQEQPRQQSLQVLAHQVQKAHALQTLHSYVCGLALTPHWECFFPRWRLRCSLRNAPLHNIWTQAILKSLQVTQMKTQKYNLQTPPSTYSFISIKVL